MNYSAITGAGAYLPPEVLSNEQLAQTVDTSDEWITSRTGIKQRHIATAAESVPVMAAAAAEQAIQAAGLTPEHIDMIVVATTTPENVFPSTACTVQQKLGIQSGIPALDVQAVCSGFVYAMDIANKYIRDGSCKYALVIGSDRMSSIIDWHDRNTCILFGDGAGAVVLSRSLEPGIMFSEIKADGRYSELLRTPGGPGSTTRGGCLQMDGRKIFRLAVELLPPSMLAAIRATGLTAADIDWLVPHQANRRITEQLAARSGIAMERVLDTIEIHGNTSAASIPLALQHGISNDLVKPGQLLLLSGFGGGFTWGTMILRYHGATAT